LHCRKNARLKQSQSELMLFFDDFLSLPPLGLFLESIENTVFFRPLTQGAET
jgi:hypothetical protein